MHMITSVGRLDLQATDIEKPLISFNMRSKKNRT